jgi:hypothetical protein
MWPHDPWLFRARSGAQPGYMKHWRACGVRKSESSPECRPSSSGGRAFETSKRSCGVRKPDSRGGNSRRPIWRRPGRRGRRRVRSGPRPGRSGQEPFGIRVLVDTAGHGPAGGAAARAGGPRRSVGGTGMNPTQPGSGGRAVLVDRPAEAFAPVDARPTRRPRRRRHDTRVVRRSEPRGAMRPLPVVVLDVSSEDPLEVAAVGDQQPVQALSSDRAKRDSGPVARPRHRPGWRRHRRAAPAGPRPRVKKSTYSRRRETASTVERSQAIMLLA